VWSEISLASKLCYSSDKHCFMHSLDLNMKASMLCLTPCLKSVIFLAFSSNARLKAFIYIKFKINKLSLKLSFTLSLKLKSCSKYSKRNVQLWKKGLFSSGCNFLPKCFQRMNFPVSSSLVVVSSLSAWFWVRVFLKYTACREFFYAKQI